MNNDRENNGVRSPNLKSATDVSSSDMIKFVPATQNCIDQQLKPLSPFSNVRWKQLDLGSVQPIGAKEDDEEQQDVTSSNKTARREVEQAMLTDQIQN